MTQLCASPPPPPSFQTMLYECPETSQQMLESGAHHSLLNLLREARKTKNADAMAASGTALLNFAQESEEVRSDLAESEGALKLLVCNLQEMDCSNGGAEEGTGGGEQPAGAAEQIQASQEAIASLIGILAEEDDSYATSIGQVMPSLFLSPPLPCHGSAAAPLTKHLRPPFCAADGSDIMLCGPAV